MAGKRKKPEVFMNTKRVEDIRWAAGEVADLAVLLHAHGLKHLAGKLNVVQEALRSMSKPARIIYRRSANRRTYGKVVWLENFRQ
jgi:hypothetical protein